METPAVKRTLTVFLISVKYEGGLPASRCTVFSVHSGYPELNMQRNESNVVLTQIHIASHPLPLKVPKKTYIPRLTIVYIQTYF